MAKIITRNHPLQKGLDWPLFHSMVFALFHTIAKLLYVQNKWIEMKVWAEIIKIQMSHLDAIQKTTKGNFKRSMLIIDTDMLSTYSKDVNKHGYSYGRSKMANLSILILS